MAMRILYVDLNVLKYCWFHMLCTCCILCLDSSNKNYRVADNAESRPKTRDSEEHPGKIPVEAINDVHWYRESQRLSEYQDIAFRLDMEKEWQNDSDKWWDTIDENARTFQFGVRKRSLRWRWWNISEQRWLICCSAKCWLEMTRDKADYSWTPAGNRGDKTIELIIWMSQQRASIIEI